MLKITRANETIEAKNIKVLIYGQPGIGKTSTAFTADDVLLLDFDSGAYRSQFRQDTVQIESWDDIVKMTEKDLEPYATIAVDTVGRLLDVLAIHLIKCNPKLAQSSGALTLRGYGDLKAAYASWLKTLISYGKDVVMVAHDKEDKNGDELIIRPDIQGGSYGEVFKQSDSIGYMYRQAKSTIFDFSPTDRWVGKNIGNFDPIVVPDFHSNDSFLADLIGKIKGSINQLSEEGTKIRQAIADWKARIDEFKTAGDINKGIDEVLKIDEKALQVQVKHILAKKADDLGLTFSKEDKKYVKGNANAA